MLMAGMQTVRMEGGLNLIKSDKGAICTTASPCGRVDKIVRYEYTEA